MGTEVGLTRPSDAVAASALEIVQNLVNLTVSGNLAWTSSVIEDYTSPFHLLSVTAPQVTFRAVAGGVTFSLACARDKAHLLQVGVTGIRVVSCGVETSHKVQAVTIPPEYSSLIDPLDLLMHAAAGSKLTGDDRILSLDGLADELACILDPREESEGDDVDTDI